MTRENLITVRENVNQDEAKRLLHAHRIEKLLVVDDQGRCVGLVTVKDIEKSQLNPNAAKDAQGRLRAAAATSVGEDGYERAERLIEAGVDLLVRMRSRLVSGRARSAPRVLLPVSAFHSFRPLCQPLKQRRSRISR